MKTGMAKTISSIAMVITVTLAGCNGVNNMAGRCDNTAASCLTLSQQSDAPVIKASCVARYYVCDNTGPYVTNQCHAFAPCTKSLELTSFEVNGDFKWCLSGKRLGIQSCKKQICSSSIVYFDQQLAILLNNTALASSGYAAREDLGSLCKNKVRIQGIVYNEYVKHLKGTDYIIHFFKRADNSLVDRLQIENTCNGKSLNSYAYDFSLVDSICKSFPSRIDIYEGNAAAIDKKLTNQFEYTLFQAR